MSPIECILILALVAQPQAEMLTEQQEFETTLATEEGYSHVFSYVRQNRFLGIGFKELVAAATESEVEDVPLRALRLLNEIGIDAAAHSDLVMPFLSHEDERLRWIAVDCLGAMHPGRFFPEIARLAVFDENHIVHHSAIGVLARCESLEAVPHLLAVYLDEDPQRAASGIRATVVCSPELQRALIPGLMQVLRRPESAYVSLSTDRNVPKPLREDAIDILGSMEELAAPYLPEIIRLQGVEEDAAIQIRYSVAIISIGGIDKKQVDMVRGFMEGGDEYLCGLACSACIQSPLLANALIDSLVALADHKDPYVRYRASWTFLYIENSGPDVTQALETLSTEDDEERSETCWNALEALAKRGELENPLDRILDTLEVHDVDPWEAHGVLIASDVENTLAEIETRYLEADSIVRETLLMLLWEMPRQNTPLVIERLLQIPLSDEEREGLETLLRSRVRDNTPSPRVTDWRLPMAETTESSPDPTAVE